MSGSRLPRPGGGNGYTIPGAIPIPDSLNDNSNSSYPNSLNEITPTSSLTDLLRPIGNNTNTANNNPPIPTNPKVLPADNYRSPYYIPFNSNSNEPKPVDLMIHRFSIWKMIIKQLVFYFKELSIFKKQTYLANKAMLENMDLLRTHQPGQLQVLTAASSKALKASMSASDLSQLGSSTQNQASPPGSITQNENFLNKFMQTAFLPPGDQSILSISSTLFNYHAGVAESELITHNQLTLKIIPRLENMKESLNETIKQMATLKNSSDFRTKDLKIEIAKTGALLADYIASVELLTKGETKTSLGTSIKFTNLEAKNDPYLLRLKLDLQLKDQLYTEAHLKEVYYDLQHKAVQLETILYKEVQDCLKSFVNLINAELDSVKDNLVADMMNGFLKNDYGIDWDYFIKNDNSRNFLNINSKNSLLKDKQIRKKSDVLYPYQRDRISSPLITGYLEKKSKYLKTYSKFYYVLTLNFMHEFKTDDRKKEKHPIASYCVNDIKISASADDPKKFIVRIQPGSSTESKSKYTFRCPDDDTAMRWLDFLTDLTAYPDPLERNSSANELSLTPSTSALQHSHPLSPYPSYPSYSNVQLPNGSNSIMDDNSVAGSGSESIMQQQHLNGSTSSLHLPTFHSVKSMAQFQQASAATPTHIAESSSSELLLHQGLGHKKVASNSSIPSIRFSSGTPNSDGSGSPEVGMVNPSKSQRTAPSADEAYNDDYFNYVAPRPKLASYSSTGSLSPPLASPLASPSAASINRQSRRAASPLRQYNRSESPSAMAGLRGSSRTPPPPLQASQQQLPYPQRSPSPAPSLPLGQAQPVMSLKSAAPTGTGGASSLNNFSSRGRERLNAQLKKANTQTSSMAAIVKQQQSLNATMIMNSQNIPQTPGVIPDNSVKELFTPSSGEGAPEV